MRKLIALLFSVVAGSAITVPTTSLAQPFTCVVNDPAGDSSLSPGIGFDGEPYQDILWTKIEHTAPRSLSRWSSPHRFPVHQASRQVTVSCSGCGV